MNTKLLTDFESAISSVADVYFFAGFFAGVSTCTVVAIAVYFLRD